jgi:hypothetical protein
LSIPRLRCIPTSRPGQTGSMSRPSQECPPGCIASSSGRLHNASRISEARRARGGARFSARPDGSFDPIEARATRPEDIPIVRVTIVDRASAEQTPSRPSLGIPTPGTLSINPAPELAGSPSPQRRRSGSICMSATEALRNSCLIRASSALRSRRRSRRSAELLGNAPRSTARKRFILSSSSKTTFSMPSVKRRPATDQVSPASGRKNTVKRRPARTGGPSTAPAGPTRRREPAAHTRGRIAATRESPARLAR